MPKAKAKEPSKKAAKAPAPVVVPSRFVDGVSVRELFRLGRQMGMPPEQFERLSGASASKLRRGRGGEEAVPVEKLEDFRRVETIFLRAVALCGGNEAAAVQWVSAYAPALNGRKPIEVAETVAGAKSVEKLLAQLAGAVGQ
jgi:putative toxin-antitoxin system antitoxin component (TIGR02293 family)